MEIGIFNYGGRTPERAHYNDAGADVFANESVKINPNCTKKIKLGIGLDLPDGYVATLKARSGLSCKGILCSEGTLDSGYTGEICAIISNVSNKAFYIRKGDKVAQIVIQSVVLPYFAGVDEIARHEKRGNHGFGSTGV